MNRPVDLAGQTAVVVGAAHGIGAAVAIELRTRGAHVVAVDQSPDVVRIAEGTPDMMTAIVGDATEAEVIEGAFQAASRTPGELSVLVHSAFAHAPAGLLDIEQGQWERTHDVLLGSVHRAGAAFVAALDGRPGAIVHIASPHAFGAVPGFAAYATAKAGLLALTRACAVEWGPLGVRCNALVPGFTAVDRNRRVWQDSERAAELLRGVPLGRFGSPEEMARAVGFLASPESAFFNGACLVADGGMTAMLPEALLR